MRRVRYWGIRIVCFSFLIIRSVVMREREFRRISIEKWEILRRKILI